MVVAIPTDNEGLSQHVSQNKRTKIALTFFSETSNIIYQDVRSYEIELTAESSKKLFYCSELVKLAVS